MRQKHHQISNLLTAILALLCTYFVHNAYITAPVHAAQSTISLSVADNISLNILPTSPNGTFMTSDTSTPNVSVRTNHAAGYTLRIARHAKYGTLVHTDDSSLALPSIAEPTAPNDYADSAYAAAHNLNNTWGYRPSKYESSPNVNYLPAPPNGQFSLEELDTIDVTDVANPVANEYNIAIGTRVDTNAAVGSYTGAFDIFVTANFTPVSVFYHPNTTDTVTNMPPDIIDLPTDMEVVFIGNDVPLRAGYQFVGWCTVAVPDGSPCSGPQYSPNSFYLPDLTSPTNILNLYAMWEVDDPCNGKTLLYDLVACRSKGTQTAADLKAVITKPTSSIPALDTSNSGVYEYNTSVFGTSSDVDNGYAIYYYRGILDSNLDNTLNTYGSNGDGVYYPNYVRLGDTCWRIVRTTASGGTKMIYNGSYSGGTTANSCANAQTNAQLPATSPFNTTSSSVGGTTYYGLHLYNMHAIGYTYSNVAASTTTSTALSTLLGSNGNDTTTNTNSSTIKQYIESWYTSDLNSYTSMLEKNAGYCADRTVFDNTAPYTQQTEGTTVIPYRAAGITAYYYGAWTRNQVSNSTRNLTLNCPRGIVDLYSTTTASGGNGQLSKPIALLTADEVALAGSGGSVHGGGTYATTYSSNYSYGSFLRSGSSFWLLSPGGRYSNGFASVLYPYSSGFLSDSNVSVGWGVRPAISLQEGTTPTSGSGTAVDPWVISHPEPSRLQVAP